MTQIVTIEGSSTPCSELPRGEQRTVVYSDRVKGLVRKGFVVLVDGPHDSEIPEPQIAEGSGEPRIGIEHPADGTWAELHSDGTGDPAQHPLPTIEQPTEGTTALTAPELAAEAGLHEHPHTQAPTT